MTRDGRRSRYAKYQVLTQVAQDHELNLTSKRYSLFIAFVWEKRHLGFQIRNRVMNVEMNFTYLKIGLLLSLLCNLGAMHGHFNRVFGSVLNNTRI